MEMLAGMLKPLGSPFGFPLGAAMLIFNPLWVTALMVAIVGALLAITGWWRRYKRAIVASLLALYAVDAAFALPRILYAWSIPDHAAITRKIPLPPRLVIIGTGCDSRCHDLLLSGALEEVIIADDPVQPVGPPVRYLVGWSAPGACPSERALFIPWHQASRRQEGFCPRVEPVELPQDGIFVVQDGVMRNSRERAASFRSLHLAGSPPGRVIAFAAVEVQERRGGRIDVLAHRRTYFAPGMLGLPPLIGCWERPDSIIWIMPAGDTGCGFWRWFVHGGDERWRSDVAWTFTDVFTPPTRAFQPPERPQ